MARGGYAAGVLLDTCSARPGGPPRHEEAPAPLGQRGGAGAPPAAEGAVLTVGEPTHPGLQALIRWDPAGLARREIDERLSAHLPPASRVATVTGEPDDLESALPTLELPAGAEVLGPVPVEGRDARDEEQVRYVVRVPRPPDPPSRPRCSSCRRSARRASCHTCGSRSTRPNSGDPARLSHRGAWRSGLLDSGFRQAQPANGAALSTRPIRLFGDPVLRTPAIPVVDFDKELRTLVQDLTDTMVEAPGSGLAAPQIGRGSAGVHLARRWRAGTPGQPAADPVRGDPGRTRGLPVDPRAHHRLQARALGRGPRFRHVRRAGDRRGLGDARSRDPARDRPPRRHHLRRPPGPGGPQGGDEVHPRGRVVR